MSEAALQQLGDAQTALIAALDAHDFVSLDAATAALAVAVDEVRVAGGWRDRPGLREDLIHMLRKAEAARGRVNGLADINRRRLEKLVTLSGGAGHVAYGRGGKLR